MSLGAGQSLERLGAGWHPAPSQVTSVHASRFLFWHICLIVCSPTVNSCSLALLQIPSYPFLPVHFTVVTHWQNYDTWAFTSCSQCRRYTLLCMNSCTRGPTPAGTAPFPPEYTTASDSTCPSSICHPSGSLPSEPSQTATGSSHQQIHNIMVTLPPPAPRPDHHPLLIVAPAHQPAPKAPQSEREAQWLVEIAHLHFLLSLNTLAANHPPVPSERVLYDSPQEH